MGDTGLEERSLPAIIKSSKSKRNESPLIRQYGKLFLFFGVILPVAAVLFETNTHYCAQHYFDPFPSPAHVVLFLLIPFSNFLAWLSCRRDLSAHYGFMALASGMAMGIGVLYGLMFLPLTPMSCIAIAAFGFGLLGLAPLLSLPCSWLSGKNVCKLASKKKTYFDAHLVEHIGHLIILVMVVAVEAPSTLTRIHLSMAAEPDTAQQGINWLRKYGSEEVMLRACYERSGRATDILGSLYEFHHKLGINDARDAFYKVTGKPFNSVPIPPSARATIQHAGLVDDPNGLNAGVTDEFDLDADIAGEVISGVARGVSATESQITGTIDPDALVGELNWSFTLTNAWKYDREARAKILLPPGAVVTKATLTIGGVEHDAKIMVRSVARAIYQDAVAQRKDPLLVSTCGDDQILVQCFPVHPNSFMKVKLTIATPLELLASTGKGTLVLPTFLEKNFQLQKQTEVNIKAPTMLDSNIKGLTHGTIADKSTGATTFNNILLPGPKDSNFFADQFISLTTDRDKNCQSVSCLDSFAKGTVTKNIESEHLPQPKRLIVLVDGSVGMLRWKQDVLSGLRQIPSGIPVKVIFFRDRENVLAETQTGSVEYAAALNAIEKLDFVGGQDDSVVLKNAVTEAFAHDQGELVAGKFSKQDTAAVLWIHGAQPMSPRGGNAANFGFRGWQYPLLYNLQVAPGPDEILAGMEPCGEVVRVNRTGSPATDLLWLWQAWESKPESKPAYTHAAVQNPVAMSDLRIRPISAGVAPVSIQNIKAPGYMAQLYGYNKLIAAYKRSGLSPSEAYSLASTYHLVSPVSSAVVTDEIPQLEIDIAPPAVPEEKSNLSNPLSAAFQGVTSQLNRLNASQNESKQVTDIEFIENDKNLEEGKGYRTRGTEGFDGTVMGKLRERQFGPTRVQVPMGPSHPGMPKPVPSTTEALPEPAIAPIGGGNAIGFAGEPAYDGAPGAPVAAPEPGNVILGFEPPSDGPKSGEKKAQRGIAIGGSVMSDRKEVGDRISRSAVDKDISSVDELREAQINSGAIKSDDSGAWAPAQAPRGDNRRDKVSWYNAPSEIDIEESAAKPNLGIIDQKRMPESQTGALRMEKAPFRWPFQEQEQGRFQQSVGPLYALSPSSTILDGRSVLVVFWTLIAFVVSMIVGTKHASRRRQGKFCSEYAVQGIAMIIAIPAVVFLMGTLIIRFLPF